MSGDAIESRVRDTIATLIGFDTVSRHSNLALIEWIQNYLDGFGVASHLVRNAAGDKANLYATVGPAVEGGVVLSGHTDVVPVDGQPWDSDPFAVVERDGRLYGRGTCDMKGFIGIALALLPEMKNLKRPIHFALSYDEEIGCLGAPDLIESILQNLPRPQAVIVGEPTDMKAVTEHKGAVMMRTTVTGHEAHSSQTHRGVSAVMTAARLVSKLADMAAERAANPLDADVEPGYTTIHVGTIQGGTALNIISRRCEFGWDVRHLSADDPQDIVDEFHDYCQTLLPAMREVAAETNIETEQLIRAPAFRHQADSDALALVKALTGQNASYKVPYLTEAGLFQQAELSTVVCGPGSIDQAHQPNEYISLEQVAAGTAFARRLIERLSA